MERERLEQERLEQQRMQDEADRALEEERLRIEEEEQRRRAVESEALAKEIYELEARAERLRKEMVSRSSQPMGATRPFVIPSNWPKDVPLPPVPPPVPAPSQHTPITPPPPPSRSRSPKGSLRERVRKVAEQQEQQVQDTGAAAATAKEYLKAQLQQQAKPATDEERPVKRHKDDGIPAQPKQMPRTLPPKPKVPAKATPGSPAPAVGV